MPVINKIERLLKKINDACMTDVLGNHDSAIFFTQKKTRYTFMKKGQRSMKNGIFITSFNIKQIVCISYIYNN